MSYDLVLASGRVVDPETGFDRVCDVGIDGDSVTAVPVRSFTLIASAPPRALKFTRSTPSASIGMAKSEIPL